MTTATYANVNAVLADVIAGKLKQGDAETIIQEMTASKSGSPFATVTLPEGSDSQMQVKTGEYVLAQNGQGKLRYRKKMDSDSPDVETITFNEGVMPGKVSLGGFLNQKVSLAQLAGFAAAWEQIKPYVTGNETPKALEVRYMPRLTSKGEYQKIRQEKHWYIEVDVPSGNNDGKTRKVWLYAGSSQNQLNGLRNVIAGKIKPE